MLNIEYPMLNVEVKDTIIPCFLSHFSVLHFLVFYFNIHYSTFDIYYLLTSVTKHSLKS